LPVSSWRTFKKEHSVEQALSPFAGYGMSLLEHTVSTAGIEIIVVSKQ
jgi:hypothetical protein